MGRVEDEAHLILKCPHYSILRMGFADLFADGPLAGIWNAEMMEDSSTDKEMRRFFQQHNQRRVSASVSTKDKNTKV